MIRRQSQKRSLTPRSDAQQQVSTKGAFRPNDRRSRTATMEPLIHVIRDGVVCDTDRRGHNTPHGCSPRDLVINVSEGFIPLWESDVVLRWRFRTRSMDYFEDPTAASDEFRALLADALLAWGNAAPVTFKYDEDLWDFEVVMRSSDHCNPFGCVLASAFFPDGGRQKLELYPKMFTQSRTEQVDTLIHELGHVFGLRHFFAQVREPELRSEVFGRHVMFSIMNYGEYSHLTEADREDLTLLYQTAWSGQLSHINGTPIRLVRPYSALAPHGATVAPTLRPRVAAASRERFSSSRSRTAYFDAS